MGILDVLSNLSGVLKFVPIVVAGVEKLFPSSKGPEKLDQALIMLRLIAPQLFDDLDPELLADFTEGVTEIISGVVKVYNAIGVFTKKE